MSTIEIYKSSAGSGKTYKLTNSYIDLLLTGNVSHRNILAVTFTNKAAGEMKSRIIKSLYLLSSSDENAAIIATGLTAGAHFSLKELAGKAQYLLNIILNDYSSFHVGTIDRFFQSIIRNFARESGLQAGFNIELNNRKVLSEAIDLLMFSLDSDEGIKEWLVKFAEEKIFSGKNWDFNKDIMNLGSEIFKEHSHNISGGIKEAGEQKNKLHDYRNTLHKQITSFESYLSSLGRTAIEHIEKESLTIDDFSYKSQGVAGYFLKIRDKNSFEPGVRPREALNQPDKWVPGTSDSKEEITSLVNRYLNSLLEKAISYYDGHAMQYHTAQTVLKNLYAYGILTDIYLKIREITKEQNLFLLSDSAVFLKRIIGNNEAPFIYEKAGNYFSYFMLDEFQDTSRYQWNNFYPLILNGLASGCKSLLVGDVKQAIYRWRNSDWRILAAEVENQFPGYKIQIEELDTNWRSCANIVALNNSFFSIIPGMITEIIRRQTDSTVLSPDFMDNWDKIIRKVYENSCQKLPPLRKDHDGYAEISFFQLKKDEYLDMLSEKLPEIILSLYSRGYCPGDITILVRKGSEGRDIADIIMKYAMENGEEERFNIISNDSLFIENHPSVKFLVSLLRFLKNPSDLINNAFIRNEYMQYLSCSPVNQLNFRAVFLNCENGISNGLHMAFDDFLTRLDFLKRLPLFALTEELIRLFSLNSDQENLAFIQAFQDLVLNFVRNQTADISSFLEWWDLNGSSQTLALSEDQDAIKIMTIHKSKGLEFPVVIIPFCDWKMDSETLQDNYLWCTTMGTPFSQIENIPVNYNGRLLKTLFQNDYLNEKFRNYIDNLNLLYVSFTRSEEELYVLANLEKDSAGEYLNAAIKYGDKHTEIPSVYPSLNLTEVYHEEQKKLIAGNKILVRQEHGRKKAEFLKDYPVFLNNDRFRLNIKNAWLLDNEKDFNKRIGFGTVMHEIFSRIDTPSDIEVSVNKAFLQGKLTADESRDTLSFLKKLIHSPVAEKWFDGSWKIMKERELTGMDKKIYRPDRVMLKTDMAIVVDYKFGKDILNAHEQQVRRYKELMNNMGLKDVKAYIWYLLHEKIVEVR